jgi:CHAT domain
MFTDYALFDIRIRGAGPERYDIDVQSAIGGDARGEFVSPASDPAFQQQIARLQALDTDEELLIEIGQRLFQALFVGGIKEVYTRSQGKLKTNQGLRLRFTIDPAQTELASLPWEFLYDPDQGPIVLLDAPIVRYLAQQSAPPVLESPLPLKVLLTGAVTPPQADVEREIKEVRAALQELEQSGHVTIRVEEHLTRTKLQRLLREGFQIWHFAGHGGLSRDKRSSALVLEDNSGEPDPMTAAEIGIFLNRSGLQLILLDACNSAELTTAPYRSITPALIRAQVGAVVAMQFKVPTEATRPFAVEFYRALAEGFPIDACVTEGRKAVMAATGLYNPDWGIPVVYTRAPDGRLFAPPAAPPKPSAPAEQGGGVNFTLGSGNTLSNSNVTFQNVANNTVGGNTIESGAQDTQSNQRAERVTELNELIAAKRRVLHKLEMQAATYGINTPPHISIEIENNEREIAKLNRELQSLGG